MRRILIVDDDLDILESLELALGTQYDVVTAADGREALDLIAGHDDIALVVLDLMMPRMSGGELMHELRSRALVVPTIIASAAHDIHHRAAELGAQDFIAKPFSLRQLRDKIASVLASHGGTPPSGSGTPSSGPGGLPDPSHGSGPSARAHVRPRAPTPRGGITRPRVPAPPGPRAASSRRRST